MFRHLLLEQVVAQTCCLSSRGQPAPLGTKSPTAPCLWSPRDIQLLPHRQLPGLRAGSATGVTCSTWTGAQGIHLSQAKVSSH